MSLMSKSSAPAGKEITEFLDVMNAKAREEVDAFAADPRHSRFEEVRELIADLMDAATRRGETMKPEQAYAQACQLRDRGWTPQELLQPAEQGAAWALFKLGLMQLSGEGSALDTVSGVANLFSASLSGLEVAREAIEKVRPKVPEVMWPSIFEQVKWPDLTFLLGPLVEGHLDPIRISQEKDDGSEEAEWLKYDRDIANATFLGATDGKGSLLDVVFDEKVAIKQIYVGRAFISKEKVCAAITISLRNIQVADGFPVYWKPSKDALDLVTSTIGLMAARTWVRWNYFVALPSTPTEEVATALYNRGLAKGKRGYRDVA